MNSSISSTSSYLDLAPLYGSNQEEQNTVRTFKDGLLKPDAFVESRILGFPPGVSVLLICFNRFHNYVATELAAINEGNRFNVPDRQKILKMTRDAMPQSASEQEVSSAAHKRYEAALTKLDNDLFQTARLYTREIILLTVG